MGADAEQLFLLFNCHDVHIAHLMLQIVQLCCMECIIEHLRQQDCSELAVLSA